MIGETLAVEGRRASEGNRPGWSSGNTPYQRSPLPGPDLRGPQVRHPHHEDNDTHLIISVVMQAVCWYILHAP